MATVLFVHGTGVRADDLADTLRLIEDGCRAFAPDVDRVLAPAWGEDCGVGGGNTGLLPEPGPDDDAGPAPAPDGDGTLPWASLLADPGLEIRVTAAAQAADPQDGGPGYGRDVRDTVLAAPAEFAWDDHAPDVRVPARALLDTAARLLAGDDDPSVGDDAWDWFAAAGGNIVLARALTAQFVLLAGEHHVLPDGFDPAGMIDGLEETLGGREQGGRAKAAIAGAAIAYVGGSRKRIRKYRDRIHASADLFVGDILVYQAHGARARDYLARQIDALDGDVVVVGHSLGGIVAFETLTGADYGPRVRLFTVGSQVSRLYRYGALATLARGGTPAHWPTRWTNAHCPQDLLGFPARPDFGDDVPVTDLRIDTGLLFPDAHSGYWGQRETYRVIAELARRQP